MTKKGAASGAANVLVDRREQRGYTSTKVPQFGTTGGERMKMIMKEAIRDEKGAALAALCAKKLEEAELRVRQWQSSGETKTFEGWQE